MRFRSLSRRHLIATVMAVAALWRSGAGPLNDAAVIRRVARMLVALFDDPRRAQAVGAAYARMLPPGQATVEHLTRAIVGRDGVPVRFRTAARLRSSIGGRIAHDFAQGDIVYVDGWMLAVTEARLCALATLPA